MVEKLKARKLDDLWASVDKKLDALIEQIAKSSVVITKKPTTTKVWAGVGGKEAEIILTPRLMGGYALVVDGERVQGTFGSFGQAKSYAQDTIKVKQMVPFTRPAKDEEYIGKERVTLGLDKVIAHE